MGFTRRSVTCLFSSCCSQWSESRHRIIVTHQQCLCREKRYCQENHPDHSCSYDLPKHWFSCRRFQWRSLALSQPRQYQYCWRSIFWLCFAYAAGPHTIVGTRIHPEHWLTSVIFSSPLALSDSGESINMVHSLYLDKLLVYVPVTKAAIMRRGFICSSLSGVTSGTIRLTTTGTFASRNDQQVLRLKLQSVTSAKFWATTRSHFECATTCASQVPVTSIAHHHEVTWWDLTSSSDSHNPFLSSSCVIFHHEHHVHHVRLKKKSDVDLSIKKVLTAKNCADVGTKPVSASLLQQHCKFAGLVFYWPWIPHLQDDGDEPTMDLVKGCSSVIDRDPETRAQKQTVVSVDREHRDGSASWVKPVNGGRVWALLTMNGSWQQ